MFKPSAIYFEEKIKEYELGRDLLEKFGDVPKVIIKNRSGKQIIAERHCVDVRFGRYLYDD